MGKSLTGTISLHRVVLKTVPNQGLRTFAHFGIVGEFYLICLQNYPLLVNRGLTLVVAKWLSAEQHFVVNDPRRPDVYFFTDLWVLLVKGLRWKIPVRANALVTQCDSRVLVVYLSAQSKIQDFDLPLAKHYILRLEIVVDNFGVQIAQIQKSS